QVTLVFSCLHRFVKYVYRIIGCTSTRSRQIADQAGETQTTNIQTKLLMVIIAPVFARTLTYAINGCWFSNGLLRTVLFRRIGTEYSDTAWPENFLQPS